MESMRKRGTWRKERMRKWEAIATVVVPGSGVEIDCKGRVGTGASGD
jgi:hypothetical protein